MGIDSEKVIKALELCSRRTALYVCYQCPYYEKGEDGVCDLEQMCEDALALLKDLCDQIAMLMGAQHVMAEMLEEQKSASELTGQWVYLQFCANEGVYCSSCHTKMFDRYPMKKKLSQFCGHCGARMEAEVQIK